MLPLFLILNSSRLKKVQVKKVQLKKKRLKRRRYKKSLPRKSLQKKNLLKRRRNPNMATGAGHLCPAPVLFILKLGEILTTPSGYGVCFRPDQRLRYADRP